MPWSWTSCATSWVKVTMNALQPAYAALLNRPSTADSLKASREATLMIAPRRFGTIARTAAPVRWVTARTWTSISESATSPESSAKGM